MFELLKLEKELLQRMKIEKRWQSRDFCAGKVSLCGGRTNGGHFFIGCLQAGLHVSYRACVCMIDHESDKDINICSYIYTKLD